MLERQANTLGRLVLIAIERLELILRIKLSRNLNLRCLCLAIKGHLQRLNAAQLSVKLVALRMIVELT